MTDLKSRKTSTGIKAPKLQGPASPGPGSGGEVSSRAAGLERGRAYLRDADPVVARLTGDRPDSDPQACLAERPYRSLATSYLFSVPLEPTDTSSTRRPDADAREIS